MQTGIFSMKTSELMKTHVNTNKVFKRLLDNRKGILAKSFFTSREIKTISWGATMQWKPILCPININITTTRTYVNDETISSMWPSAFHGWLYYIQKCVCFTLLSMSLSSKKQQQWQDMIVIKFSKFLLHQKRADCHIQTFPTFLCYVRTQQSRKRVHGLKNWFVENALHI